MSEFSEAMADSWTVSKRVFGTVTVRMNDMPVDVVEHSMDAAEMIAQGRPGRQADILGELCVSREDWLRVGGRQGLAFRYGHLDVRVVNDPLATQSGAILTLRIKTI